MLQQHLQDQRSGLADAKQQASSSCSLPTMCIKCLLHT